MPHSGLDDRGRATAPVIQGDGDGGGSLNITETRATLGRTARLECSARNISGKKMVRLMMQLGNSLRSWRSVVQIESAIILNSPKHNTKIDVS